MEREERVILEVLYLEITQGKIVAASLELLSKSCCALLLFLLLLFFLQLSGGGGGGGGRKKKKETEPKKNFEGLILASIQTDVACHSVVKQAADWSKQQQFRGNCSRTGKWEIYRYINIFFFLFFVFYT